MKDNLKMDLNMDTANLPTLIKNILVILLIIYMKVMDSLSNRVKFILVHSNMDLEVFKVLKI
jgi:hypothetical protein